MAKRVFYSFHYVQDRDRVAQVRNVGMIEDNPPAHDNEWKRITGAGDRAIGSWIDGQLHGRSCTVVMIGAETAGRKWIDYEIETSWNSGKGVVGVHIHNLRDLRGQHSIKGGNPFGNFMMKGYGSRSLATVVKIYDPPEADSKWVYAYIRSNLSDWIDEAIRIRTSWA